MNIVSIKSKLHPGEPVPTESRAAKVIAITSGKGGVGKTNVTVNLAIALAKQGSRVCIFDADTSLANINVVIGLTPTYTIEHLLTGERTVEEILLEGPQGVMIVPAASGISECANLDQVQRDRLIETLQTLENSFDYLLIDTAAGIGESVIDFIQSAQYTILVISTEPTSLTDAFALLRVLKRRGFERPAYVLVNMALNYANSMEVFKRFEAAVRKYLGMKVHYLGYITEDKAIKLSIGQQRPVILNHPDALASRCFTTLAAVLSKQFTASPDPHAFSAYWNELAMGRGDGLVSESESGSAAGPTEREVLTDGAARELQALTTRLQTVLGDPALEPDAVERMLSPLVEIYRQRFQPAGQAREAEAKARSEQEKQEGEERQRLLDDYRALVGRLEAEETLLHKTLLDMYEYINREMAARTQSLE